MSENVTYGQYNDQEYVLTRFHFDEIPMNIMDSIRNLCEKSKCALRGGMAYIYLIKDYSYMLKDIDLLGEKSDIDKILHILGGADHIFVNKNTFNQDVITAFWKSEEDYYKIDVLLVDDFSFYEIIECNGFKTVTADYLWKNRLEKIVQKEIRHHSDDKTRNHFYVASNLAEYLVDCDGYKYSVDSLEVKTLLLHIREVLADLMNEDDLEKFMALQNKIIQRMEMEHENTVLST